MVILRKKEMSKLDEKEIIGKIHELKLELIKQKANVGKGGKLKTKEIKRTIARLHTFSRLNKLKDKKSLSK